MINILTDINVKDKIYIDIYQCGVSAMDTEYRKVAEMFKAFSDENRIHILKMLSTGEKCACKLLEELNISQPTLSHHMKILCDAGIVTGRREGKWMHYAICCEGVKMVRQLMQELLDTKKIPADCQQSDGQKE